jgi:hypothetical protein
MTRRNALRSMGALALATLRAAVADLNGKWRGTATTPERSENVLLILRVNGAYVAGSLGPNEDRRFPIENGRLDGNQVTFQLTGPKEAHFKFELTLDGDSLKGSCSRSLDGQTENGTLELKRADS